MSDLGKYFQILDLDSEANQAEIKQAYKDLAQIWHPDKHENSNERIKRKAEEKFREIKSAYESLVSTQPEVRKEQAWHESPSTTPNSEGQEERQKPKSSDSQKETKNQQDHNEKAWKKKWVSTEKLLQYKIGRAPRNGDLHFKLGEHYHLIENGVEAYHYMEKALETYQQKGLKEKVILAERKLTNFRDFYYQKRVKESYEKYISVHIPQHVFFAALGIAIISFKDEFSWKGFVVAGLFLISVFGYLYILWWGYNLILKNSEKTPFRQREEILNRYEAIYRQPWILFFVLLITWIAYLIFLG